MKEGQKLWTREELVLAVNLYCKMPFGKMHKSNPDVINFSRIIGRTPSSVAFKLVNFASFDPTLQRRGIKGATNASKLDREIWNEFYNNWEAALFESEQLLAKRKDTTIEELNRVLQVEEFPEGLDRQRIVKTRINQNIFRTIILATYNNSCCITGISNPELLVASHISPWSKDEKNRMNPMNGLALNALHDKAFEVGLITIDANSYKVKISPSLYKGNNLQCNQQYFLDYEGKEMVLPDKFRPDKTFLKYHNDSRFKP